MEPVSIAVDDRESTDVRECLLNMEKVDVSVERLKSGDYLCDRRVLFERKRLCDFANSIKSGRLFNQACRLASSKYRPVMILEGKSSDLAKSNMGRDSIQGPIINLTVLMALPLLRSRGPAETGRLIVYTARQLGRQPHGSVYRHGYRPKGDRKRKLFVLQGLPGIGPERAARLLDHFGNLESIFFAGTDEIAAVEGVGCHTAQQIRKLVRETSCASYGR